jgi:hypothetical protein
VKLKSKSGRLLRQWWNEPGDYSWVVEFYRAPRPDHRATGDHVHGRREATGAVDAAHNRQHTTGSTQPAAHSGQQQAEIPFGPTALKDRDAVDAESLGL